MNMVRRETFLLALCILSVTGCVSLVQAPKEAQTTFLLTSDETAPLTTREALPLVLYVPRATAPVYLDSTRILFSWSDDTLNSYQYAQWAEPPPARLTGLVVHHLELQRIFQAVTRHASGTSPDLALNLELLDFRHHLGSELGEAVVIAKAEIVDLKGARIVEAKTFTSRIAPTRSDARHVATALNAASQTVVAAIADWLADLASELVPQAVVVER
jgi:ABC-type uncharacterized transport system auxiliary subunit